MPSDTFDNSRPRARRMIMAIIVLAVAAIAVGGFLMSRRDPELPTPPPIDPRQKGQQIISTLDSLLEALNERQQDPWFENTAVVTDILRFAGEIQTRASDIRMVLDNPTYDREIDSARDFVLKSETVVLGWLDRFKEFQRDFAISVGSVRDAFGIFRMGREAMAVLSAGGITFPEEEAKYREYARLHEDGRRYWLSYMGAILAGRERVDSQVGVAGVANLKRAAEDALPIVRVLDAARIEWFHFQNHFTGIEGRLLWAETTIANIPADDPFKTSPESSLGDWRERYRVLKEKAMGIAKRCMDRSREHEHQSNAVQAELSAFLAALNRPFIDAAKRHNLPLPK